MDLLGSILGSMEKPPSMSDAEKKTMKAQREKLEKQQERERVKIQEFREKIQSEIKQFIRNGSQEKLRLAPMEKTFRAIVHEVADIAGLVSFAFGQEEQDRYVMLWKKEFAPSDDELMAYRKDEEWDPVKAKEIAERRAQDLLESQKRPSKSKLIPNTNYQDKYKHLIGETAAKDAAQSTVTHRSYGFVSSENKRDQRTIEQVLADTRAKKKLKTEHNSQCSSEQTSDNAVNKKGGDVSETV